MPSAKIDTASSGQGALVASPGAGKWLRVHAFFYVVAAAVTVKLQSASTDKTGAMPHGAQGDGICVPWNEEGWFDCAPNEALNINLGGAVQVSGAVRYSVQGNG